MTKIDVPDTREEGKNADEQAKIVMLRILRIVDKICRKEDIPYWVDFGTLIGVIRHSGYIPWDDDIDIVVPRKELKRLEQAFEKYLPDDIFYQTYKTDEARQMFISKIRDKYSTFEVRDAFKGEHTGIFIDVFAADYVKKKYNILFFVKYFYPLACSVNLFWRLVRKSLYPISKPIFKAIGIERLDNFFLRHNADLQDAKYISYGIGASTIFPHKKETIFPLKRGIFEGYEVNIPNDSDKCLRNIFGDYMQFPPEEERVNKHAVRILPFTPCSHPNTLNWEERKKSKDKSL